MARKRPIFLLLGVVLLGGAGYMAYRSWWQPQTVAAAPEAGGRAGRRAGAAGAAGRPGGPIAVSVTVAPAERKTLALTVDVLGTVQALSSVVVRSQVEGTLTQVLFEEGQQVKRGDILARIDDRTYKAALAQAEGLKAYHQAQLTNARLDLNRYVGLLRANGVTSQQVDTQRAQVAMFEAQIAQDQAAIDTARTQLDYTTIRAPIDGRIGLRQVDPGNLVRGSDTEGLATVSQFSPIGVSFTLPQQELPRLLRAMQAGPVPVETLPTPSEPTIERGTVLTLDNQVTATTGTVQVKASFANTARRLWPGAFVSLRLPIETVPDALVVPLVAAQQGPAGSYVFLAKEDNTVEQRPVTLGAVTRTEAVVRDGLAPGDRVVTSGGQRLSVGTRINIVQRGAASPGNAASPGSPAPGAGSVQSGPGAAAGGGELSNPAAGPRAGAGAPQAGASAPPAGAGAGAPQAGAGAGTPPAGAGLTGPGLAGQGGGGAGEGRPRREPGSRGNAPAGNAPTGGDANARGGAGAGTGAAP
jgi:multidrug efflux system membrane fusion protein